MLYTFNSGSLKNWAIDPDGFLKRDATVLKSGVLSYHRDEVSEKIPDEITEEMIRLYVPVEELESKESLESLEGKPLLYMDHSWQKAGKMNHVGNVAGSPEVKDGYVIAGTLINDPIVIDRIENKQDPIGEVSSAYSCQVEWQKGISPDGEQYDGIQRGIRYNHVAIIKKGTGRAGEDVRILNRGTVVTSEFTTVRFKNKKIRVLNEDAEKLSEIEDNEKEERESIKGKDFERLLEELEKKNEELDRMTGERDEIKAKLEEVQERLEHALLPEVIEEAAEDMLAEQDDAEVIMEANNMSMKDVSYVDDDGEPSSKHAKSYTEVLRKNLPPAGGYENEADPEPESERDREHERRREKDTRERKHPHQTPGHGRTRNRSFHGHDLKLAVVNKIRIKNGGRPISNDMSKNKNYVEGCFQTLLESAKTQPKIREVPRSSFQNTKHHTVGDQAVTLARTAKEKLLLINKGVKRNIGIKLGGSDNK
jgi:hypothetical protein